MKRILIFVVILLTTLSIVNALNIPLRKRAIAFATCPSGSPQFTAASIDPDPPVAGKTATAKVTFTVPAEYTSGKFVVDATPAGGESLDDFPEAQDVCTIEGIECPIAAGSTVEIQTPVEIPDDVPDTYTLEYSLVDGTGKEIACSSGPVTGAAKAPDGGPGPEGGKGPGPGDGGGPDDGGDGPAKGPGGDGDGKGPAKGPGGDGDGKGPAKGPGGDGDGKGPAKGPGGDGDGKGPAKGPGGDGDPDGGPAKGKEVPPDGGDGGTPP